MLRLIVVVKASALQSVDLGLIALSSHAKVLKTVCAVFLLDALHKRLSVIGMSASSLVSFDKTQNRVLPFLCGRQVGPDRSGSWVAAIFG